MSSGKLYILTIRFVKSVVFGSLLSKFDFPQNMLINPKFRIYFKKNECDLYGSYQQQARKIKKQNIFFYCAIAEIR